ncbi:hypothetical protein CDAR_496461 [Caerostris darwini]|uniref:Uncharacterized protein n=1 Tax=Caerostris darwini TaxID=1538125 RepID=A0AAV4Q6M8_9ARAC|nr:hypothetical protein CDAR_496461 [Caerostris darwini]
MRKFDSTNWSCVATEKPRSWVSPSRFYQNRLMLIESEESCIRWIGKKGDFRGIRAGGELISSGWVITQGVEATNGCFIRFDCHDIKALYRI